MMPFIHDDGGRAEAGYKGLANDCVVRAIAIASGLPYQEVYDAINSLSLKERVTKSMQRRSSSREGVYKKTYEKYLFSLGWKWTPTMKIGSGCKVHLTEGELPGGRIICRLSRHITAVIDGVIHDNHNPQRETHVVDGCGNVSIQKRCVYGYWSKEQ